MAVSSTACAVSKYADCLTYMASLIICSTKLVLLHYHCVFSLPAKELDLAYFPFPFYFHQWIVLWVWIKLLV